MSNRDALLEAAIEALETKGYARTTARDLVAASNTNLNSIGYHFGSKEQLMNEALIEAARRWLTPLIAQITQTEHSQEPFWPRFQRTLSTIIDSFAQREELTCAFHEATAQLRHSERTRGKIDSLYSDLRLALTHLGKNLLGNVNQEDAQYAETLASLVIALVDGLMIQWQINPEKTPDGKTVADGLDGLVRIATRVETIR